jgi:hypothetical protein
LYSLLIDKMFSCYIVEVKKNVHKMPWIE